MKGCQLTKETIFFWDDYDIIGYILKGQMATEESTRLVKAITKCNYMHQFSPSKSMTNDVLRRLSIIAHFLFKH